MSAMDPYVIVKFSNQTYQTKVASKGGKNPTFNETATFHVNSSYKKLGRSLEFEVMDKKTVSSDALIGYGIVDLDPYVGTKPSLVQQSAVIASNISAGSGSAGDIKI